MVAIGHVPYLAFFTPPIVFTEAYLTVRDDRTALFYRGEQCVQWLQLLRRFGGEPDLFLSSYLHIILSISFAVSGLIALQEEKSDGGWRFLADSNTDCGDRKSVV